MNLLIFPHQLFAEHPGLSLSPDRILLIEDSLFFGDKQYPARFHKQKLWLHRATMKRYQASLHAQGLITEYIDYDPESSLQKQLVKAGVTSQQRLCYVDPTDFILQKRLCAMTIEFNLKPEVLPNALFLNTPAQNEAYRNQKTRWFQADFYQYQRQRLNILMEGDSPVGGKWSYDEENRKKVPKKLLNEIPSNLSVERDEYDWEAKDYVESRFQQNPGNLDALFYPTSHHTAHEWLNHFLSNRLERFGNYEDAIVQGESWLWHSILTPLLNIGLLTPGMVVNETLKYAAENHVALNSLEGFLRQIIGWREFMRATYEDLGVKMRTTNHWQHRRKLPHSFYLGTTGIVPIDDTIKRILNMGYCHHIERLMVLGGFMFLCEIDPNEIYRWFMEMFVDSYDWVMVPNVYAMSQNADGGMITTKPYFSGSSYVRRMSHYKQDSWCEVWDGLYWRWIWNHKDELGKNPRWAMMCRSVERMDVSKRETHLQNAEAYLSQLENV